MGEDKLTFINEYIDLQRTRKVEFTRQLNNAMQIRVFTEVYEGTQKPPSQSNTTIIHLTPAEAKALRKFLKLKDDTTKPSNPIRTKKQTPKT